MKNIFIFLILWVSATLLICCATACKKNEDPQPIVKSNNQTVTPTSICQIDITKFVDVLWVPFDTTYFAKLKFYSNGNQYQQGETDVTWHLSNNCDSVKVNRGQGYFYKIKSVTTDTLKLINPLFGQVIYHK